MSDTSRVNQELHDAMLMEMALAQGGGIVPKDLQDYIAGLEAETSESDSDGLTRGSKQDTPEGGQNGKDRLG